MATTRPSATDQQFDDNGRSAYLPAVDQVKELQIQVQQQQQQITMLLAQMQIEGMRIRQTIIPQLLPQEGIFTQIPGATATDVTMERTFNADGSSTETFTARFDPVGLTQAKAEFAREERELLKASGAVKGPGLLRKLFDPTFTEDFKRGFTGK